MKGSKKLVSIDPKERIYREIDESYQEFIKAIESLEEDENGFVKRYEDNIGYEGFITDIFIKIDNIIFKGVKYISDVIKTSKIEVDNVVTYSTKTPSIKLLVKQKKEVMAILNSKDFDPSRYSRVKVPGMTGLKITLLELANIEEGLSDIVLQSADVLEKSRREIYKLLETKIDDLGKNLPDRSGIKERLTKAELIKENIALIMDDTQKDMFTFFKLVKKFNNVPILIDKVLTLGEIYNIESLDNLNDKVEIIVKDAKLIVDALNKSKYVKKSDLLQVADFMKSNAEYISGISLAYYFYFQLLEMTVNLNSAIKKNR